VYRFMPNIVQITICSFVTIPCHTLLLVVRPCSKPSKPLGTPSKLIQILGDGNCLFRELPYAVTGRQVYYTRVRAQTINHMRCIENIILPLINSSLDSSLANSQMARNKGRGNCL